MMSLTQHINEAKEDLLMSISKDFKEKIISRNVSTEFSQLSNGQKSRISFAILFGFLKLMEHRNLWELTFLL